MGWLGLRVFDLVAELISGVSEAVSENLAKRSYS